MYNNTPNYYNILNKKVIKNMTLILYCKNDYY